MAKQNVLEFLNELDELIRVGKGREATSRLQAYRTRFLPREHRTRLCQIARRLRLNSLALRLLNPIVRPTSRKGVIATEREKAEYAAALSAVGAIDEAIGIFESLNAVENPQVLLMKANAHFAKWNYAASIPLLRRYLRAPQIEDYWNLVGKANLAAALVFERQPEAEPLLRDLIKNTDPVKYRILHGYALELQAEKAVWAHKWEEAKANLHVAEDFFRDSDSIESLFIRKWFAIVELFERGPKVAAPGLHKVELEARARKHWETIRSLDYHRAIAMQDPQLVARLLLGTPFESLRHHLLRDYVGKSPVPHEYPWILDGAKTVSPSACFTLDALCQGTNGLKAGMALHKLLTVLTMDIYRPLRIAEIHTKLFPGEYFNPISSPHRVAQLINRLRQGLKKSRSPIRIEECDGAYQLKSIRRVALILRGFDRPLVELSSARYEELRKVLGTDEFSIQGASKALSLSLRSANRVIFDGLSAGVLTKSGKGKSTKYRFV